MARRLKTIAKYINENLPGLTATVNSSWSSTDQKAAGYRYITNPGKGRSGNRLKVFSQGTLVFDHDSSKTYRTNDEVEQWLADYEAGKCIDPFWRFSPGKAAKHCDTPGCPKHDKYPKLTAAQLKTLQHFNGTSLPVNGHYRKAVRKLLACGLIQDVRCETKGGRDYLWAVTTPFGRGVLKQHKG